MKRWSGVWLIFLIVGMSLSTAFSSTPVAAATSDPYEEFWQILNREAELVVEVENGNLTLASELIQNSRLGAENAVNISVLIWQALEELKASGVKTYYTAEELREMAQNISENGLPGETVQALKSQGWSDNEIQALEGYITQNAGEINEDFNMTAFLEDFSTAFISVAFKYNHYEAWALEEWKWRSAGRVNSSLYKGERMINPLLADEWVEFYKAYENGNVMGMRLHAESLRQKTFEILTAENAVLIDEGLLTLNGESIRVVRLALNPSPVTRVAGGGVIFRLNASRISLDEDGDEYYWPSALRAYELTRNVESLVKALGDDSNPELWGILNEKVAELKLSLIVHGKSGKGVKLPGGVKPPSPPGVIPTLSDGVLGETPDELTKKALDINEGVLEITDVKVIVDVNQPGRVEYHVQVSFKAENNAVNDIQIHVQDYASHDEDSGSVSFLNAGESYTWESKRFSYTHSSGGELIVNGVVEITYTPSCNDVPLSSSPSCQERTITEEYSATVDLTSPVDWNKVGIRVEASRESITEGESVTYRVIVENNQNAELDGVEYSVTIPFSPTNSRTYSGVVKVNWTGEEAVFEKTVTYTDSGTYVVHASIYWNGHSKSAEKSVTVTSGTLTITDVDVSPSNPTHGDSVSFDVSVKNPVSRSRSLTVKLFIDGVEKLSRSLTISAGGSGVVTLTWTAQAGEHEWRIEVWEGGKLEASRSGSLSVSETPSTSLFNVGWEVYPRVLYGGGTVFFKIYAWNFMRDPLNLSFISAADIHFRVTTGDGALIKDFTVYVPGGGAKYNIANFSYRLYGVGNYTFILTADWGSESHTRTVKVEVKPIGNVVANMDCQPTIVSLGSSTTCYVHLELIEPDTVTLNLEEIDFGGKKVWPNGPSSVRVEAQRITLSPTNIQETLSITINIDDSLANYYFGKPIYKTYLDKFADHSYLIEVKFGELGYSVSDVITVIPYNGDETDDAINHGLTLIEIGGFVRTAMSSDPVGILITLGVYGVTHENDIQWILEEIIGNEHFPQEQDNNDVVGG